MEPCTGGGTHHFCSESHNTLCVCIIMCTSKALLAVALRTPACMDMTCSDNRQSRSSSGLSRRINTWREGGREGGRLTLNTAIAAAYQIKS